MSAIATEGASMLAMASKRVRSSNWRDTETTLLANLKREAFLRGEEGSHVWHDILRTMSGRSALQCQRRWETLVKVYNHVQDCCTQTGQDHEELDDEELASMKVETAYGRDWYMIVQEVCSGRKRRRICDGGAAAMLSKGSSTPVMGTFLTTRPATTDSSSRETLDFENHVGQVATSTVEQTWRDLEFLVPESSWPEYPRHDRGVLEAGNFTFNCFSPSISFPLRFFLEDRIQEYRSQEHQYKKRRGSFGELYVFLSGFRGSIIYSMRQAWRTRTTRLENHNDADGSFGSTNSNSTNDLN